MKITELYRLCLALTFLSLAGHWNAQAAELDLSLSNESINAEIITDSSLIARGGADLSLGIYYNDESDLMGNLGLMVSGVPAGETPFSFGVGTRFYGGRVKQSDDQTIYALAIGGRGKYTIPANIPMHVGAQLFYAPKITTWSDGKDLLDFTLRYEIEVIPQTLAFVGYRLLRTNLEEGGHVKLDNNVHLGVRLSF
jgi:hypothetical protein